MKRYITLLFLITGLMASCQSGENYVPVPENEIDSKKLEMANAMADKLLMAQKAGKAYVLSPEEAIPEMLTGLSEKRQKDSYAQIKRIFGDYQDIRFDHMMRSTSAELIEVYRFKGNFDRSESDVEVRVVFNNKSKLAGFFVRPWRKKL